MCAQFPDEQAPDGAFKRQEDAFRQLVTTDGSTPFAPVAGRYHLYVCLACPWASRTLIVRNLLGLQEVISVSVVDPIRDEKGWAFREGDGYGLDPINGFNYLSEAYAATDPDFTERVTVPVLWDKELHRIVNNNEDDICRMFADVFAPAFGAQDARPQLFPQDIAEEQAELSSFIYENVNNGVYSAGFASSQGAYDIAFTALFRALEVLEQRLATQRFLFGNRIVETDWRLFCTLVRFDAVYHGHFKCNLRRIIDLPNLHGYLLDLYQQPGIAATVNMDHIKRHYYYTHDDINPSRIVPLGPLLDLTQPHGREKFA
ncbi:glutathione-dependent reductase [Verrucomicrobia bacterium LW23]|nr:glutathione-dependent reductase [Verrucomicrobia bacterium LW23]